MSLDGKGISCLSGVWTVLPVLKGKLSMWSAIKQQTSVWVVMADIYQLINWPLLEVNNNYKYLSV